MKHHVVVVAVAVMMMSKPVGAPVVYLHITYPHHLAYFHLCIEEVGSTVAVVHTRVYHLYLFAVGGEERF